MYKEGNPSFIRLLDLCFILRVGYFPNVFPKPDDWMWKWMLPAPGVFYQKSKITPAGSYRFTKIKTNFVIKVKTFSFDCSPFISLILGI